MSAHVKLTASDGHRLDAYLAEPETPASAAIVVVQEIFGVNGHIRSVADDYASEGFAAIAPALFDRMETGAELAYTPSDASRGMQMAATIGFEKALLDVSAAIDHPSRMPGIKRVGVVGFCFGGTLAWLAATRLHLAATVCYYGGQIARFAQEQPRCPVLMHFGSKDAHIPSSEREKIRTAHPKLPVFLYEAGHGFNCNQRKDYEPHSVALARDRSLDFLRTAFAS